MMQAAAVFPAGSSIDALLPALAFWPEPAVLVDRDGRVLGISDAVTAVLGWLPAQLTGQDLWLRLGVESPPDVLGIGETHSGYFLTEEGGYIGVDYRLVALGTVSPATDGGKLLVFYENRALRHNQDDLRRFAGYVEHSPGAMAEFDNEGQMIFSNPAMQALLLQHGFDEMGSACVLPKNMAALCHQVGNLGETILGLEVPVAEHWYSWYLQPQEQGGLLAYVFDISARKSAELASAQQKAAVRRDFYAKMVHELRTPLNAIVGFSQLLLKRGESKLSERDLTGLRAIRLAGLQLNDMITDTLDAAKLDAGRMELETEWFHISEVLDSLHDQMAGLAEAKALQYRVSCPPDARILSDYKKLRQILVNLIGNAIKYTDRGFVNVTVSAQPGCFIIEVMDSGRGIAPDQQQYLFEAYFRAVDPQRAESGRDGVVGTGLGLALVADLTQLLKAQITLSSQLNSGSRFCVTIPVDPQQRLISVGESEVN